MAAKGAHVGGIVGLGAKLQFLPRLLRLLPIAFVSFHEHHDTLREIATAFEAGRAALVGDRFLDGDARARAADQTQESEPNTSVEHVLSLRLVMMTHKGVMRASG
jgi:hypothetical protein